MTDDALVKEKTVRALTDRMIAAVNALEFDPSMVGQATAAALSALASAGSADADRIATETARDVALARVDVLEAPAKAMLDDIMGGDVAGLVPSIAATALLPTSTAILYVKPTGNDSNNGLTWGTAKKTIGAAVDAIANAGTVNVAAGTYAVPTPIKMRSGITVNGAGPLATLITTTATISVFEPANKAARSDTWGLSNLYIQGPGKGTVGAVGIDLHSVSSATLSNLVVKNFGTAIWAHSESGGWAVYNRLTNCQVLNSAIGIHIDSNGSNASVLTACRAGACDVGIQVSDSNETHIAHGQIELCGTGVKVVASSAAKADFNCVSFTRFESNTIMLDISEFSRSTQILAPLTFNDGVIVDNGDRTNITGGAVQSRFQSAFQSADGTWRFSRVASGGAELPAVVMEDTVSTSGSPVTVEVRTRMTTTSTKQGWGVRLKTWISGAWGTYFDVDTAGNVRSLLGGFYEFTPRLVNPATSTNTGIRLFQKVVAGKQGLYAVMPSGTVKLIVQED